MQPNTWVMLAEKLLYKYSLLHGRAALVNAHWRHADHTCQLPEET
jgi:hypothetical protein